MATITGRQLIAAIYARKSTEQAIADDQRSVSRQIDHARNFAAAKAWTVAEEHVYVDDGISGAEFANRPGFVRLMAALKPRAPFQVLVMSEESRLGREAIETAYALKQLVTAGVRVFFYMEDRERRLDSPTDKIMLSLTTFADELEREKARQRTFDAMQRKARAGHVTGGRVFGYANRQVCSPDGRRSHVVREINETEAAVVRRIFQLCADGRGLTSIAKQLNADRVVSPRSQQGRPRAWAPSTVREVLHRDLYRGLVVWNRTRKRNAWGQVQQRERVPGEWIRMEAPELRIVPDDLWLAAHQRITRVRASYLRGTDGRLWGRPLRGTDSKYLLPGLARCGICNGSIYVKSRKGTAGKDRAFFYGCTSFHLRGSSVCSNGLELPMELADRAVLDAFARDILRPEVIEAALERAAKRLDPKNETRLADAIRVQSELQAIDEQLERLTGAIAAGGDVPSLLTAVKDRETAKTALKAELAALKRPAGFDPAAVRSDLLKRLEDWRGLFLRHVPQARQIMRKLLTSAITLTPTAQAKPRRYEFKLEASVAKLLGANMVASPPGFEPGFQP
jgi:site-specific DNA recombinase